MINPKFKILAGTLLLTSMSVAAGNTEFNNALDSMVRSNMRLRMEQTRNMAEVASLKSANELAPLEIGGSYLVGSNNEVGNKLAFSVSQGFDWPALYAARRRAAESASSASQFLYESALLDSRAEARTLLIDLIHANKTLALAQRQENQAHEIEKYYRTAVARGTETRIDLNKAIIEHINMHAALNVAKVAREEVLGRILAFNPNFNINGLAEYVGTEYPEVSDARLQDAIRDFRTRDPRYAAARAQAQKSRDLAKVADMSNLPGFSIGYEHETEAGGSFNGLSVGITLPVWSRKSTKQAARLEAEVAAIEAETEASAREAEMQQNFKQLSQMTESLAMYKEVLQHTDNYDLLRKAFDSKTIDLLHFLQESSYFMEAEKEYLDLQHQYQLAVARQLYLE